MTPRPASSAFTFLEMRRTVAAISEASSASLASERLLARMRSDVGFVDVLVGELATAEGALEDVSSRMEVHVHANVVPARVHLVANEANVPSLIVQAVGQELLTLLFRRRRPWKLCSRTSVIAVHDLGCHRNAIVVDFLFDVPS